MGRRKIVPTPVVETNLVRKDSILLPDGFTITRGEFIKIKGKNSFGTGEWGLTFKFDSHVTNIDNGAQWIDCYEMFRGRAGVLRSFRADRIKRIPKRRKRVSRTTNS